MNNDEVKSDESNAIISEQGEINSDNNEIKDAIENEENINSDNNEIKDAIENEENINKDNIIIQDISKTESEIIIQKEDVNEEKKIIDKKDLEINDDLFITEKDRFSINITYYFDKNLKEPFILGYDNDYFYEQDEEVRSEEKSFTITFKYPNQQDTELIMSSKPIKSLDEANFSDFITLENIRIGVLIREWSINKPLKEISQMHPKIIKAIRIQLTNFIGSNGFF